MRYEVMTSFKVVVVEMVGSTICAYYQLCWEVSMETDEGGTVNKQIHEHLDFQVDCLVQYYQGEFHFI